MESRRSAYELGIAPERIVFMFFFMEGRSFALE